VCKNKVTLQERTLQIHCAQNSYLEAKAAPSGAGSKNDQNHAFLCTFSLPGLIDKL